GSAPSGNMQLIASMGSILYKMTPIEVIHATTINTAYAMGISKDFGSICRGKKANFYITTPMPSLEYLPYSFGDNKVETVVLNGKIWQE
ncbi:MAG: amidohydrolase family protein, partial [Bacteroidales bacterium]|nr:amidohydrolase family protein [Bacteroidales bacterium]